MTFGSIKTLLMNVTFLFLIRVVLSNRHLRKSAGHDTSNSYKYDETQPGSDRDEHDCIPSAGYTWCESREECIREFDTECPVAETSTSPPTPVPTSDEILGGDRDEHGCIPSAGYTWCEVLEECIREFDTECPVVETSTSPPTPVPTSDEISGGDRDENGCIPSAGYTWCEVLGECIQPFETVCAPAGSTDNNSTSSGNSTMP